jgi:hypothetical protein
MHPFEMSRTLPVLTGPDGQHHRICCLTCGFIAYHHSTLTELCHPPTEQ